MAIQLTAVRTGAALLLATVVWPDQATAHPPYGLVVDTNENVYFSDLETVWRLKPNRELEVFRPGVAGTHVHEVVLTPDGAIEGDQNQYDPQTQRFTSGLWRRTPAGSEHFVVPMTERPPAGFGVWQDARGNRYASYWRSNGERRTILNMRDREGRPRLLFAEGKRSPGSQKSVGSVGGMAFSPQGSIYFADRRLLRKISPDGKATLLYEGAVASNLRGLAASEGGRLLAADMGTKTILAISSDGSSEILYREGDAWLPTAVAQVSGRLLVLEANADHHAYVDRVRVVEVVNGRATVIAEPGAPVPVPPIDNSKAATTLRSVRSGAILAAAMLLTACIAVFFADRKSAKSKDHLNI